MEEIVKTILAFAITILAATVPAKSEVFWVGSATFYVTQRSFSNNGGYGPDGQFQWKNVGGGATIKATGEGYTGFLSSRLTDDAAGPVLRFHKGRGSLAAQQPVQQGDSLGTWLSSLTVKPDGTQAPGTKIESSVIAAVPSETSFESELCIYAASPEPSALKKSACFRHDGLWFPISGRRNDRVMMRVILDRYGRPQIALERNGKIYVNGVEVVP